MTMSNAFFLLQYKADETVRTSRGLKTTKVDRKVRALSASAFRALSSADPKRTCCEYGCKECSDSDDAARWAGAWLDLEPVAVPVVVENFDFDQIGRLVRSEAAKMGLAVEEKCEGRKGERSILVRSANESRLFVGESAGAPFAYVTVELEALGYHSSAAWNSAESDEALIEAIGLVARTAGTQFGAGISLYGRRGELTHPLAGLGPVVASLFRIVARCFGELYYPSGVRPLRFNADSDAPIDISPPYQRDSVWTKSQQMAYVRHVLKTPASNRAPIVLRREAVDTAHGIATGEIRFTRKAQVVDGKQRLLALRAFFKGEFPVNLRPEGVEPEWVWWHQFSRNDVRAFSEGPVIWIGDAWTSNVTDADVISYYIELNRGTVGHTEEEIEKAEAALREAKRGK